MTNYEYIKTLSQDEMIQFIVKEMTMVFNDVMEKSAFYWLGGETDTAALEMWKNWLNEQHEESSS